MSEIKRYCKLSEEHYGDNCFDVSRPNIMGNPYTHIKNKQTKALIKVATRDEAIARYGRYFENMLKSDDIFRNEFERMVEACMNYDIVYIGCFCRLDEKCHGDYIVKRLRRECTKRMLNKLLKKHEK